MIELLEKIQDKGLIDDLTVGADGKLEFYLPDNSIEKARELCGFLTKKYPEYVTEWEQIHEQGSEPNIIVVMIPTANPLKGKNVVITGTLSKMTRTQAEKKIVALGGRLQTAISGNTDYLIVGDKPGSKLNNAKKRGVTVLTEKQFEKMIK